MLPNLGEKLTPRQTSGDGRSGRGSGPAPLDPLHEGPRVAALERRARELSRALADCETLLKKVSIIFVAMIDHMRIISPYLSKNFVQWIAVTDVYVLVPPRVSQDFGWVPPYSVWVA